MIEEFFKTSVLGRHLSAHGFVSQNGGSSAARSQRHVQNSEYPKKVLHSQFYTFTSTILREYFKTSESGFKDTFCLGFLSPSSLNYLDHRSFVFHS